MLRAKILKVLEADTGANPVLSPSSVGETPLNEGVGETPTSPSEPSETLAPDTLAKEIERLQASLKRANAEAKQHRQASEELKKLKEAELTETQRLQKQYDDLKASQEEASQAQFERSIQQTVAIEAAKLGVDPNILDKVARFLAWEEIEVDDDGEPTNVRALVEQLVKDIPGLKPAKLSSASSATNPSRSQSTAPQALSWDVIGRMKPDEYAARRDEIQQWIAHNPHRYGSRLK